MRTACFHLTELCEILPKSYSLKFFFLQNSSAICGKVFFFVDNYNVDERLLLLLHKVVHKMSESKPSELPSWLEDNEDEPTLSFNHATKKVESSESKQKSDHNNNTLLLGTTDTERKKQWVYWGFKVLTIGICMLMLTTAVLSMAQADSISYSGKIMTAVYMIIFTLLLLVFEIAELQQVVFVEHFYHRNFGFLFKPKGKSLFIIL